MTNARLLFYFAIGNLVGALLWNPPVKAWDLASWATDSINGVHASLSGNGGGSNEPLPVPQIEPPPIGNPGNTVYIKPCAAPPPMAVKLQPSPVVKRVSQSPQVSQPSQTMPVEVVTDRIEYNQGGSITQAQADRMSRFKKNQSYKAIRSLLGTPNYREPDADIYIIQGTGDGISVPRKLIVSYALDAEDNFTTPRAMNWYQQ